MKQFTEKFGQGADYFFREHLPPAKAWRRKVPAGVHAEMIA
jgi:hypothetical protein